MSRGEKTTVDIINRPSHRASGHNSREWVEHLTLTESQETLRDIRDARDRLGQFSVRFVTEAIFGEEMAAQIFGHSGGRELVRDMRIDQRTLKTLAGDMGGERAKKVAERLPAKEVEEEPENSMSDQQVELLRALLKTMDPAVVKRALTGG